MNVSLNLLREGAPVHVTAVYNFSQVKDIILLKFDGQKESDSSFLNFIDNTWQPENYTRYLTDETLRQINRELLKVYKLHKKLRKPSSLEAAQKELPHHWFMLCGLCS